MKQRRLSVLLLLAAASVPCAFAQGKPADLLSSLNTKVDELLAKTPPPLFAWHLRSLRALAATEFAKLDLNVAQNAGHPVSLREKEFTDYVTILLKGLDGENANPDAYLKEGRRALVLARPSAIDGTLQAMMVDLPKDWDPATAYPLFVGLHGSGPDNPLAYPSYAFGPADPNRKAKPTDGMIRLAPWGRGNRGWRGDAERDLFEAIEQLKGFAKLDPDRWYLTGHSSGADGAWAILQHTPDLWAAAGIQSGSMISGRPEWGLMANAATVPVHFLIGEKDDLPSRVPDTKEAFRLMTELGDDTKLVILPGIGHYPLTEEGLDEQATWMIGHVRKRPDHFSFTADQAIHPGIWGVNVAFAPTESRLVKEPWPSFDCKVDGPNVRIETKNVKNMRIDLGPNGLGLSGNVRLWIDGRQLLNGPVPEKPLELKLGLS